MSGQHINVGFMTSGGLAPCLASSIAYLVKYWAEALRAGEISGVTFRCYIDGYKGILTDDSFLIPEDQWDNVQCLHECGGSPIGNSRVKLTNVADCLKRGFVEEGMDPLEKASQRLIADKINVIHTIGGDDTNTQAAELSAHILEAHGGKVVVIGMPKTIDNDVYPIQQTFGADTAAEQGALYFNNVVSEHSANPRMLICHECMGRDCGYLTAATALKYRELLSKKTFVPGFTSSKMARDVHAIWIPELPLDIEAEAARLGKIMDEHGCVNVFMSEGCGVKEIIHEMEKDGKAVIRDSFGHAKLDSINPGKYYSEKLSKLIKAEKTLVQKSGYFSRAAMSNDFDRDLIGKCAKEGVKSAIAGVSGCMGADEDKDGCPIRAIEFDRVAGGKPLNVKAPWVQQLLSDIGQA